MFSKQLRKVLPLAVADIAAARPFSPETRMMIALVNSRTRRAARNGTLDLEAQVYAADASREK